MNPLFVGASDFRSWAHLECDLPEGVTAVVGANGAGKSSLISVVEYALFGDRHLGAQVARGCDSLQLACQFEAGGDVYDVRRRAGGKPALSLHRGDEDLSAAAIADTQARIDSVLGMTRATFRASAYLAQGDGAAFTEASPSERKAVLAEILGLRVWGWLEERAKADHRLLAAQAERDLRKLEQLRRELEDRPEREQAAASARRAVDAAKAQLVVAEQAVEALEARERAAAAALQARESLRHAVGDRDKAREARDKVSAHLRSYPSLDVLETAAAGRADLETMVTAQELERERWQELQAKHRADERRLDEVEKLLAKRPADPKTCPTCGQPFADDEHRGQYEIDRRLLVDERDALAARPPLPEPPYVPRQELREAMDAEGKARWVRAAIQQIAEADQVIAELDERIAELEPRAAAADVGDGGERKALAAQREVVSSWLQELSRAEADLDRLKLTQEHFDREMATQAQRWERLDLLNHLLHAYGRDGVPAMIVENVALPQIEAEAGRILADLGTDFTVELRTQRMTQKGEIREALDIIVRSGPDEAPYESFSGGERTRVNLALRIALARLLATRRGAQVRALLIDEPEFLDAAGMERLAAVLQGLRDDFDRILVVSHHDSLRHAFDQVIAVERNGDGSHFA